MNTHMRAHSGMNEHIHSALHSPFSLFLPFHHSSNTHLPTYSNVKRKRTHVNTSYVTELGFVGCLRCAPETTKDRTAEV